MTLKATLDGVSKSSAYRRGGRPLLLAAASGVIARRSRSSSPHAPDIEAPLAQSSLSSLPKACIGAKVVAGAEGRVSLSRHLAFFSNSSS